jgi:uncharacterized protein (TIGR02444 family)
MPAGEQTESFWDFSVRTYRSTGVPAACLSLQNEHAADVNMVLYCCWIGRYIGRFDDDLFTTASEFSRHWAAHVVEPLRSARTWMKLSGCNAEPMSASACMELRDSIKSVEFASEKLQQDVLASLVPDLSARDVAAKQMLEDVAANLDCYSTFAGFEVTEAVSQKLSIIIDAAFAPVRLSLRS